MRNSILPILALLVITYMVTTSANVFENTSPGKAQDNLHFDLYPMNIGDIHIYNYKYQTATTTTTGIHVKEIIDTTTINGKKYYVQTNYGPGNTETEYLRIDTLTGNLLKKSDYPCPRLVDEELVDSLAGRLDDITQSCGGFEVNRRECQQDDSVYFYGQKVKRKKFKTGSTFYGLDRTYYSKIGLYLRYKGGIGDVTGYSTSLTLRGCIVDGVLYGDPYLLNVTQLSNIVKDYKLNQNYPNPFNPSTNINFSIPKSERISLTVYDVLGNEVNRLINNETMGQGEYNVKFEAQNLPSGVYFYKLTGEKFTEVKKMMLVR